MGSRGGIAESHELAFFVLRHEHLVSSSRYADESLLRHLVRVRKDFLKGGVFGDLRGGGVAVEIA